MNLAETREFWKGIRKEVGELCFIFVVLMFLYGISTIGKDDSDPPGWFTRRSGVIVRTDNLTGCQYLVDHGITPRLDKNGKQVGCR